MPINITVKDGPYYSLDTSFSFDPGHYLEINKELFIALIQPIMGNQKELRELRTKRLIIDVNYRTQYIDRNFFVSVVKKRRGDTGLMNILKKKDNLKFLQKVDEKLYKATIAAMWNAANV